MNVRAQNRAIQSELCKLVEQRVLSLAEAERIRPRYPTEAWNLLSLARWFTILGAVAAGVGFLLLIPQLVGLQNLIDFGLALALVGSLAAGHYVDRRRGLHKTGAALELLGGFALQGLLTALAFRFNTGSGDWPRLVTVSAVATGVLAYALPNRLVLTLALLDGFVAFGGETGYDSGWGMYWLDMNYPSRFVLVGLFVLGLAWLHARLLTGARQGFARVYFHHGLLVTNLALWFFALFGRHDLEWHDNGGERALFSLLWAGTSIASLLLGSRYGWRLARGYGLTFLIINLYTVYFQFIAVNSAEAWFLHLLVIGVSLVGLGFGLERQLSRKRNAS